MTGYAVACRFLPADPLFRRVQVAGHLFRHRRRDRRVDRADRVPALAPRPRRPSSTGCRSRSSSSSAARRCCCRTRRSSNGSRPSSTGCSARSSRAGGIVLRPQPARAPDARASRCRSRLVAPHVVVGRVLRVHGRRQLVRRVSLSHRDLGQLQGLGRHRACSSLFALAQGMLLARHVAARKRRDHCRRPPRCSGSAARAARRPRAVGRSRSRTTAPHHVGHAGAAGGAGHFSLLIVSESFSGLSAARAAPAGAARASPIFCRIRSTRCRSRRWRRKNSPSQPQRTHHR